jgi:hypothetical protein
MVILMGSIMPFPETERVKGDSLRNRSMGRIPKGKAHAGSIGTSALEIQVVAPPQERLY